MLAIAHVDHHPEPDGAPAGEADRIHTDRQVIGQLNGGLVRREVEPCRTGGLERDATHAQRELQFDPRARHR